MPHPRWAGELLFPKRPGGQVTVNGARNREGKSSLFAPFCLPFIIGFTLACCSSELHAQQSGEGVPVSTNAVLPPPETGKRILGIIPNNRTWPSLVNYKPLSTGEKFAIARQDSFDRGTVLLGALFAGDAQLTRANPSYGQGVKGYAHYFGAAYADLVIGNYMSEAIFPAVLRQDPRYFRRGAGSGWSRLGYSMGQVFWTHTDSDRTQFNYSEILGNATAVAISNAYDPDHRSVGGATSKFGTQIGIDMASNVLKEFWPDLSRKHSRKNRR
jgi:hypothetical protein